MITGKKKITWLCTLKYVFFTCCDPAVCSVTETEYCLAGNFTLTHTVFSLQKTGLSFQKHVCCSTACDHHDGCHLGLSKKHSYSKMYKTFKITLKYEAINQLNKISNHHFLIKTLRLLSTADNVTDKINFLYEPTSRSELFVCVTVYTTETGTGLNASTVSARVAHQILSVCAVHHEDKALVRGGRGQLLILSFLWILHPCTALDDSAFWTPSGITSARWTRSDAIHK